MKMSPLSAPLEPWMWPTKPLERIHLDFAGLFQIAMFLVAVDAHSKWPEAVIMSSTTAFATVATYRLPAQVVTDNGSQYTSEEFTTFLKLNGIKHTRSALYHPASNGQAEQFVQSLKQALKASYTDGRRLANQLASFHPDVQIVSSCNDRSHTQFATPQSTITYSIRFGES